MGQAQGRALPPELSDVRGVCCRGRATRNPTIRKGIAVATAPRDAERGCHGANCHEPPRTTRRSQLPVVPAEPSAGVAL
jgi:hypothetical protein